MNNKKQFLEQLKEGQIRSQKRGIHFILASVFLWSGISVVRMLDLPVLTQNLFTFCMSAPLMPLAYFFSRLLKIQFNDRENPLTSLGILLALAQMPYLLIVMWAYRAAPEQMVMLYAMVVGAHFLPYGWLYKSKVYYFYGVFIPIVALIIGCMASSVTVAISMVGIELSLCAALLWENKFRCPKEEEDKDGSRNYTREAGGR